MSAACLSTRCSPPASKRSAGEPIGRQTPTCASMAMPGLNKGEAINSVRRAVFFHRQGEIRDRPDQQARHPDNQIIGPSEKDHLEPAIGSRRVRASGNAAAQRAAIAQNPCAPKRSKIGPPASVRRAVAIPMPTVP